MTKNKTGSSKLITPSNQNRNGDSFLMALIKLISMNMMIGIYYTKSNSNNNDHGYIFLYNYFIIFFLYILCII